MHKNTAKKFKNTRLECVHINYSLVSVSFFLSVEFGNGNGAVRAYIIPSLVVSECKHFDSSVSIYFINPLASPACSRV